MKASLSASLRNLSLMAGLAFAFSALPSAATPRPLHTSGNQIYNDAGAAVRLKGVNIPSLEWSASGENVVQSVNVAIDTWHANLIRLPISQDRWWGAAGNDANAYRAIVDQVVNTASNKGCYVLIDMHWSDMGAWGANIGQHFMPDDNTTTIWNDVAWHYANNPAVLFDPYNEPNDVSWSVWRNGGTVTENGTSYHTPGMQSLVNTIRAKASGNLVVVGGLDWAYDLTGIVNGYGISASNLVYASHIYPWKSNWDQYVSVAQNAAPIIISEFGTDATGDYNGWMNSILGWIDSHNFNATAWCMHTGATPCLITDWNYTPSYWFGTYVKNWLAQSGIPEGTYQIVAATTGNVLDCYNCSTANGTMIQLWGSWGGSCQKWNNHNLGNGYYSVRNINPDGSVGRSLDCSGCSPNNGTQLELWDYWGGVCQQWAITPTSGSNYQISSAQAKSDGTHDVLDGNGCSGAAGAHVILWSWGGGGCQQQWQLVRVN